MEKECTLSTGTLPLGGLPRYSVIRITDCPEFTSDAYRGQKASNLIKQKLPTPYIFHIL